MAAPAASVGLGWIGRLPDGIVGRPPAGAATAVVRDVEVFVLGVVDVEKERKRLVKHRDQIAGRLEAARRKLSNENFLSKARPDVVERERERVTALEAELATVEKHLEDLEA